MEKTDKLKGPNPYLVQKVNTASPEELISYLYDIAITACMRKEKARALEAIQALINALDFNQRPTAMTFYRVYRHLSDLIAKEEFSAAQNDLREIKQAWNKAFNIG